MDGPEESADGPRAARRISVETGLLIMALAATLYVMHWLVHNDGAARIRDQTGLCRMKPPPDEEPTAADLAAARAAKGRRPDPRRRAPR